MPEISRFLGIIIYMYFNDHEPSHFHVKYNEYRACVRIDSLTVIEGKLPARVLGLVIEWAVYNRKELYENWESIIKTGKFNKIPPLV